MDDAEQLLALFRVEAVDILTDLTGTLSNLQRLPKDVVPDALKGALRAAHNVKGAAAIVGVEGVERLAHAAEDLLQGLLATAEAPSQEQLAVLLAAVAIAQRVAEGEVLDSEVAQLGTHLARLKRAHGGNGQSDVRQRPADRASSPPKASRARSHDPETSTVRVNTERLDGLMACVGDLLAVEGNLLSRSTQLAELSARLSGAARSPQRCSEGSWRSLAAALQRLVSDDRVAMRAVTQVTNEISEATKRVRMLPLRSIAPLWRQVVAATADELEKDVELILDLEEVELDRFLLERLRDPLMHCLRNAVDHGLEPRDERATAGKPARGTVLVRARLSGASVRIEISDDGRGLDVERVGDAAVRRGLVTPEDLAQMRERDVLALVFTPGFSTAGAVTKISGRGVGLDVVQQRVEDLGGRVEIGRSATLGGSTFFVTVPASVLSSKGLLVRAGAATYVLPTDAVRTTLRLDRGLLGDSASSALPREGQDPLPIRWLGPLMGHGRAADTGPLNVVVVTDGDEELGLVVQEVVGDHELVTKALPWNLLGVKGVSGAVVMPGGELALVVDVPAIVAGAARGLAATGGLAGGVLPRRVSRVLVVDDSLIARNRIKGALAVAEHRVVTAEDGEQAWSLLFDEPFDLIITDVQMPKLDGLALTRRIRRTERLRGLPVVLVTSLGSADHIADGAAAGADEYLVKGAFDDRALLQVVERLT